MITRNIVNISRVSAEQKPQIVNHLIGLTREDRYFRFCGTVSNDAISGYVQNLQFHRVDAGFAALRPVSHELVGFAHVSAPVEIDHELQVEIGVSVDAEYRGQGIATALMRSAIQHCVESGYTKLYMSCLRDNKAMQHIAKSLGLHVVVDATEAFASLDIAEVTRVTLMDTAYRVITKE